jgi:hypothetical protein
MMIVQVECRWAFLGLSAISEKFVRDLHLPPESQKAVSHKLVAVSTSKSIARARKWFKQQEVPEPEGIQVFPEYRQLLEQGDFDVSPLHIRWF